MNILGVTIPAVLAQAFVIAACSGGEAATNTNVDAGSAAPDANVPVDASTGGNDAAADAPHDAAQPVDASRNGQDAGQSQDAGIVEDAGADDPRLSDPSRASFPFECQGTPMAVSDMIEHFGPAEDLIDVTNARSWNNAGSIFRTGVAGRTCNPQTGCSAWSAGSGTTSDPSFYLWLHVDRAGVVSLEQLNWQATPILARNVPSGEFQMVMGGIDDGVNPKPPSLRYVVRVVRNADNTGCISAASVVTIDPPRADGSTFQHFYLGVAKLPARATIPRPTPAPRTAWASACQGTPAEDGVIASWFAPGASRVDFSNANAKSRTSSQSCHPITGCTEWSYGTLPSWRLWGLQTNGTSGFAVRLDNNVSLPIAHGVPGGTISGNTYSGLVATSGCVSYDEKQTVTYSNSDTVVENHVEEQNKAF